MVRIYLLGLSLLSVIIFIGCGSSNPTLATIGNEKITLHEFEDNYAKHNNGWDSSKTSSLENRQKFLDLYVKYKLKLKDAYDRGLDRDSAVISELDNYRSTAVQSKVIEDELVKPGIEKMYERKKEQLHVSHIFFRLAPDAKPEDTLAAYERAMKVLKQIPFVPFDTLALKYSEEPATKIKGGDLGFIPSSRLYQEFGDAFFLLKTGECSKMPVRTRFGYHIIKLTGRRPNIGTIRLSTILRRFNESFKDTAIVRDSVWILYRELKNGADFSTMVKKYSQDPRSVPNKGDIGFFDIERIPPDVANIFYLLKTGSITEPMQFKNGFQIFKVTEKNEFPPFSEMEKDLRNQYQAIHYPVEYRQYLNDLKVRYKFVIDSITVIKLVYSLDTAKSASDQKWNDILSAEMLNRPIFSFSGHSFTIRNYIDSLSNPEYKNNALYPSRIWTYVNKFAENMVLQEYVTQAIERNLELTQDYRDYKAGTLLYRIEQDEVWKKAVVNDSLLIEYYNAHKENYRWPDRVNFVEIYTLSDSSAKEAYWQLLYGEDFKDVAQNYTNRAGYKEKKGEWGLQPITLNNLSRKASTMAVDSVTEPFHNESGWSIIKMLALDTAHIKSYEEAMLEVAGEYQEAALKQREQEWVEVLIKKYPVSINKDVLLEAFKRKRVEAQ